MAWRRPGNKPLSEPMVIRFPTHICVTRPQGVDIYRQTSNMSRTTGDTPTASAWSTISLPTSVPIISHMFHIAAISVKFCYITVSCLFWLMSWYTLFGLLTTMGKYLWNKTITQWAHRNQHCPDYIVWTMSLWDIAHRHITMTSQGARWHLKLPASPLFSQLLFGRR